MGPPLARTLKPSFTGSPLRGLAVGSVDPHQKRQRTFAARTHRIKIGMKKKLRVGVIFGGRSGEHEVSLLSAASVLKAIDPARYEVVPIGITKQGLGWFRVTRNGCCQVTFPMTAPARLRAGDPQHTAPAAVLAKGKGVIVPPMPCCRPRRFPGALRRPASSISPAREVQHLDVVFPVLHGTFGEDGTMQGLFELAGLAYVGSGVLGSAAGMDKEVMKRLFLAAGLPITKHVTFLRREWEQNPRKTIARIEAALKYPLFVKPANLGSSVGISKAHDRKELGPAIDQAAGFDRKIVVEQAVGSRGGRSKMGKARELEVAVLGNDEPVASVVGEIVPGKEFYDYEAKYLSEGSQAIIPAKLTKKQSSHVRAMALDGLSRLRLRRIGTRGLSSGGGRLRTALPERDEHHARLYFDQHVSQAVGGLGHEISRPDFAVD